MVNAQSLGDGGRKVRCASCGHIWLQKPEAEALKAAETAEPIPDAVRPVPEGSALPAAIDVTVVDEGPGAHWSFAFVCFALIFTCMASTVLAKREALVRKWEPSARLFSAIGKHVPVVGEGLVFSDARAYENKDPQDHRIYIEASVKNGTAKNMVLPAVDVTVLGPTGLLDTRHYLSQGKVIEAGQAQPFRIPVSNPPDGGDTVILIFSADKAETQDLKQEEHGGGHEH